MSHIAVIGTHGLGHAIPTLDTVATLVERGHRVSYLVTGAPVTKVAATGATVVEYDSVVAGVDLAVMDTPEEMARLMVLGVAEDAALIAAAERHLASDRPDLIISDATRFTVGRILGSKWDVPIASFCTVLNIEDRAVRKQPPSARQRQHTTKALKHLVALLAAHGQSHLSLEEFYRPKEGLFVSFFPRSFQFDGDTYDDRHVFAGPNLNDGTDPGDWTPPAGDRPVLMISLGTSVHRRPEFFRMCVDAFRDSEWHLIMHVHAGLELAELGELPPNVEVHRWLPQLAVLAHTDVLLCHGGVGTLMAAFATDTPVVVVPSSAEQMVNTDRVLELGLGRAFTHDTITAEALRRAVEELHADPATRARVEAMHADIDRAGGAPFAADAIEAYLKQSAETRATGPVRNGMGS